MGSIDKKSSLLQEILPVDWHNDERMGFLMSAFKDRSVNPKSWDAKLKFWRVLIEEYCVHCKQVTFDEAHLKKTFERDGCVPACLTPVIISLKNDGKVVPVEEIQKLGYHGQSWSSWTTEKLLKTPASFAVNKLWSALGYDSSASQSTTEKLVSIPALQSYAEEVLAQHCPDHSAHNASSQVMILADVILKEPNKQFAELAIMWLCRNNQAIVEDTMSPALVKFGPNVQISNVDRQTISLQRQEIALTRKLHELEEEKERCLAEIKAYLAKGMRPAARNSLKKKHELERRATKLSDSLANLHVMISQLKDSESHAQVIGAYKNASAALKAVYKDTGLNEDNVANAMDDVEEALELHDEVKTVISKPVGPMSSTLDDEELEKELAELLEDHEEAGPPGGGTSEFDINKLPSVPSSPVGAKTLNTQASQL
ncbi:charged multivesicular body protein 7 [Neocloeon triangulifer]|uniref:charged multivesicular body protein 7 n=1 Tax=Neocloeon triangulifer TaxID=2078957 RepID=UPI00286F61C5|nr:charged multivesicular body protein 7 [Neocloeon triangulifer]